MAAYLRSIECYIRQPDSVFWTFSDASGRDASMELTTIQCRRAVAEVYDKVDVAPI